MDSIQYYRLHVKISDLNELFNNNEENFEYYSFQHDEYWEIKTQEILDYSGKRSGYIKQLSDISAKVKAKNRLEELSKTDELTSLKNRRELLEQGNLWIRQRMDDASQIVMLLFDIDFFKLVNDTFGHSIGDEVIRNIGQMLRVCFRSTDIVTRYGGEEFVAMIRVNQMEEAEKLAWRILANMQESSFVKSNPNYKITLSAGVSFVSEEDTIESLLEKADYAMYKAKEGGRNRVSLFQNMKK